MTDKTPKQELYDEAVARGLPELPEYDDITEAELRERIDAAETVEPEDPSPDATERTELIEGTEVVDAPAAGGTVVYTGKGTVDIEDELAVDDAVPAVTGDAEVDDDIVRTNSAVEPIADALGVGAGAPSPPPGNVDADGREQFPNGVAPTAVASYDGPGAPAGQSEQAVEDAQHDED